MKRTRKGQRRTTREAHRPSFSSSSSSSQLGFSWGSDRSWRAWIGGEEDGGAIVGGGGAEEEVAKAAGLGVSQEDNHLAPIDRRRRDEF